MIKQALIYLIKDRILANNPTTDVDHQADPRNVELALTAVMNTIFFDIFKKDKSNLDTYTKTYKNVAITQDTDTDVYYSVLPVRVVQFPQVGDGIMGINEMKGKDVMFMPLKNSDYEMIYGSEAAEIDDVVKFTRKGSVVEYLNLDPTITQVRMDLVPDFGEWDMYEDVPIPSGQDMNVVNMVVEYLKGDIRREDKLNNANTVA